MLLISIGLIYWGLFISLIGFAFFMYGKKRPDGPAIITGIILMAYPYFVSSVGWSIGIGIAILAIFAFLRFVVRI